MLQLASKMILILAALSSAAPADYCLLKLMGRCCLTAKVSKAPCCKACATETGTGNTCRECGSPLERDSHGRKACCAYTPSDSVYSSAMIFTAIDTRSELPPAALFDVFAALAACTPHAVKPAARPASWHDPQSAAPALFLLDRSFLI